MGADGLGVADQVDGFGRGVGSGAGDNGNASARYFDAEFDGALVLVMAQSRCFAGRAHGNQPVHAARDLAFHQGCKGGLVESAIAKRGNKRRNDALEEGYRHWMQKAVMSPLDIAAFRVEPTICRPWPRLQRLATMIRTTQGAE